jgi:hypothetical protein
MLWTRIDSGGVLGAGHWPGDRQGSRPFHGGVLLDDFGRLVVLRFTEGSPPKSNRHPQLPVLTPATFSRRKSWSGSRRPPEDPTHRRARSTTRQRPPRAAGRRARSSSPQRGRGRTGTRDSRRPTGSASTSPGGRRPSPPRSGKGSPCTPRSAGPTRAGTQHFAASSIGPIRGPGRRRPRRPSAVGW